VRARFITGNNAGRAGLRSFYELTRQRVEEMRQQQTAPEPPKPVYARGSVEWSRQQAEAEETNR